MLSAFTNSELILFQSAKFRREYLIQTGNEVIGSLNFRKAGFRAVAEISGKKWEIKRVRFWSSRIGIYQTGYDLPFAEYSGKGFGKAVIELPMGIVLNVQHRMWRGITEVKTPEGKLLFSCKRKRGWKDRYIFTFFEKSDTTDKHPWIIMLIAYLYITRKAAAIAAV